MALHKRSLRNIINYILILMGLFALLLVWFTVTRYQGIVLSEQRNAVTRLTAHVAEEQLATHASYLIDLGMTMQAERRFRAAFRAKDSASLNRLISDQFHQYFSTTGLVALKQIALYDSDFNLLTRTHRDTAASEAPVLCPALIAQARTRTGTERNKPLTRLCRDQGTPYHSAIVPIGGLTVAGYAAIIADPVNTLAQLQSLPGMPYRISMPSGERLFSSEAWPATPSPDQTLIANHTITLNNGEALLNMEVASDIAKTTERLSALMLQIVLLALLVTALFIFFTRGIFQKRIVYPLMRLNRHMARVQRNQEALGKGIELSGCRELDELSNEFNAMARKLLEAQRELHEKAHTDALTGLPNRETLYSRLEQLERLGKRTGQGFCLLMLDLDKFKQINDTMGHHAGDTLIQQVGQRLSGCLRESDTVARLGGDEFAILLPTIERREDAIEVSQKLLRGCTTPFTIDGKEVSVGASIGIAIYPQTAEDADYLMRCADKSMYAAKRAKSGYNICEERCGKHSVCHSQSSQGVEQEQPLQADINPIPS
ncbi:MAG: diguanylate cyclase domain-containing protein [Pseudomonadota bacterium]